MSAEFGVRDPAAEGIDQLPQRVINIDLNTTTMGEVVRAINESDGSIPFSQYMDIALYGPDGYYSKGKADIRVGAQGDFKTWPVVSTDFCEAVGVATSKLWVAMGEPKLDLVESGAGNGVMMKDILAWMRQERPELYHSTSAHIIEQGDMALKQRHTIGGKNDPATTLRRGSRAEMSTPDEHQQDLSKVRWHRGSAIERGVGQGDATVLISNELPDAFPVEVARKENGSLQQKYVAMNDGQLVAEWRPLQAAVQQYMEEFSVDVSEGAEIAVNLNSVAWQRNLNGLLRRGGIITVDYGSEGPNEVRPSQGGLAGILSSLGGRTQPNSAVRTFPSGIDPLQVPGEVDLTSDVDFRVLARVAVQGGLEVAFSGTQSDFLATCGVPTQDELSQVKPRNDAEYIRIRATREMYCVSGFRALVLTREVSVDFGSREPLLSAYSGLIPNA